MTKILYMLTEAYMEGPIYEIAEELQVEVIPMRIPREIDDAQVAKYVAEWEDMGVDIILCRGSWDKRVRKLARRAFVMGLRFSFETTLSILCGYQEEHPDFFKGSRKKVMLMSTKKLPLNMELMETLFHAEFTNVTNNSFQLPEDLIRYASQFDLVICGTRHCEVLLNKGLNAYHQTVPEVQTLHENFILADVMAKSRQQLREKNEEIQNILDNSFNAILSLDREGVIRQGNGQVKQYFKQELQEIIGKKIYDFLPGLNPSLLENAMESGKGFYGELVEFDSRVLVMNSFPLRSKGEVNGAALYFEELRQIERVEQKIKSELYKKGLMAKYRFEDIKGRSEKLLMAKKYAHDFAKHSSNILIYGESGTGKELFAQSIHNHSTRKNGPFVAVNCGALPSSLLESELFGYVGGAFTGASKNGKKGLLEQANKGTIFLDEISEMEPMGQVRLLRVLEERVISRIGDDRVIPVDVRIIAASNKNLRSLVEEGKFREDLYYRLNVLMLRVPPLREREGDIRLLADEFIRHFGELNKKRIELEESAYRVMERYPWKGNVRQLRNFCERLVIIANERVVDGTFVIQQLNDSYFEVLEDGEAVKEDGGFTDHEHSSSAPLPSGTDPCLPAALDSKADGKDSRWEQEKARLVDALNQAKGRREEAAELLGISKTSLWRKMKKYGVMEKY